MDRAAGPGGGLRSPFLSPAWAIATAEADGPDRRRGRVAIVREAGRAVGFMPARVSRYTALPLGMPMADCQGLIAAPGLELDAAALVRALRVGRLDLINVLADQPTFRAHVHAETPSHVVDLDRGFEAYARDRRSAGHDVLRDAARKRRKLEREQGALVFTARSRACDDLGRLIAWKRAQLRATGQTDIFAAGWTERLVRRLHRTPAPGCEGVLFTLHAGGRLAAAHLALMGRGVLHSWLLGHAEAFAAYSPGVGLIVDMLAWAEGKGVTLMDLGPGDYRYKLQLANASHPLGHGFVGRPSLAAGVRAAEFTVRRAAERLPLGRYSALPGKAMRRLDQWRGLG